MILRLLRNPQFQTTKQTLIADCCDSPELITIQRAASKRKGAATWMVVQCINHPMPVEIFTLSYR